MFESGEAVARALRAAGADLAPEQVQPNGVDLTAAAVFETATPGRIGRADTTVGDRRELSPDGGAYDLAPGAYVVRYGEPVRIPEGRIGFVYPRSSLLRNACTLDTAVWDAGYEGVGAGRLHAGARLEVEPGARIAQLVFARASHDGTYAGRYQGEGR